MFLDHCVSLRFGGISIYSECTGSTDYSAISSLSLDAGQWIGQYQL